MDIPTVIPCYFMTDESREIERNAELCGHDIDSLDDYYLLQDVYFFSRPNAVFQNPEGEGTVMAFADGDFRTPMLLDDVVDRFK